MRESKVSVRVKNCALPKSMSIVSIARSSACFDARYDSRNDKNPRMFTGER